ncbi:Hydroxymethylglutaryl-CoA lyase [Bosea sp. 62]|uniref:hydroxymethylglutaryl-CoA lyase n=1 Tax=unclassified Bosea (in: a-proteobacteria) TaxID=2653178 RepID=UPI0012528D11|nr:MULTISPECIES: hydroxymethylglutaryl-CoA lyase [unclassified Bosea (in: a-proteobacteria)]CAD5250286.1 Hydroxymethylglutaryl-CoA lyase [Bosea sp. 7B]CAD5282214.1 Hydroxymethylglutaryl-CoA lyase [Bosea sp. 21B]CAD5283861.1 Hydroxymethylglutaryl-CoA lyase [Bosea sp. 46]VVT52551.1 Hydroxymethylglutaryl-CoA lyase [Bosea sp. EC-HK365B]VXB21562.1 Hydroxymethylglutaryl-CoA lyase [Bosea sp. 62]
MAGDSVTIVEVGPRDGLQNETAEIATAEKLALIGMLADAGLSRIEATAFVSPRWVPQMADHEAVMRGVGRRQGVSYSALVPNEKGAEAALAAGAQALAVFTAASESFCRKNTNCLIAESIERFRPVMALAERAGVAVRGYVSCALDCPYEGKIAPEAVATVTAELLALGCSEIALSDTLGRGTPERTATMVEAALRRAPAAMLAGHFHDTSGQAIANVAAAWELGLRVFDGSVGGLGGCPYAPGAAGNLATERLVAHFEAQGIATGIDRARLEATAAWIAGRRAAAAP